MQVKYFKECNKMIIGNFQSFFQIFVEDTDPFLAGEVDLQILYTGSSDQKFFRLEQNGKMAAIYTNRANLDRERPDSSAIVVNRTVRYEGKGTVILL